MTTSVREITAILVSWNDLGDLRDSIASLVAARGRMLAGGPKLSLIVVDNGSGNVQEAALAAWPGASCIVNAENRGFGPAVNQAAELAHGDILLFVNPDARAEGDPFTRLAQAFDSDPRIVAVAPRLLDPNENRNLLLGDRRLAPPDREDQFTFQLRRLPTLSADARELLLIDHAFPNSRARRHARYADADRSRSFEVEQPAAAALAVRKSVFAKVHGFDLRYVPAWFEDVDLCERLQDEGRIVYWPEAVFRHRGGAAASRLGYERFLLYYYRNALLYRRSRYSVPARAAYRALLAAGMMLRLALTPLRHGSPRPASVSAAAYWEVLRLAAGIGRVPPPPPLSRVPSPAR